MIVTCMWNGVCVYEVQMFFEQDCFFTDLNPKLHQMQICNFLQAWGEAWYNSQTLLIMLVRLVAGEYVNGYTTAHAVSITVMYLKLCYAHSNVMTRYGNKLIFLIQFNLQTSHGIAEASS